MARATFTRLRAKLIQRAKQQLEEIEEYGIVLDEEDMTLLRNVSVDDSFDEFGGHDGVLASLQMIRTTINRAIDAEEQQQVEQLKARGALANAKLACVLLDQITPEIDATGEPHAVRLALWALLSDLLIEAGHSPAELAEAIAPDWRDGEKR
jgi:hypothetical protein